MLESARLVDVLVDYRAGRDHDVHVPAGNEVADDAAQSGRDERARESEEHGRPLAVLVDAREHLGAEPDVARLDGHAAHGRDEVGRAYAFFYFDLLDRLRQELPALPDLPGPERRVGPEVVVFDFFLWFVFRHFYYLSVSVGLERYNHLNNDNPGLYPRRKLVPEGYKKSGA
jgi:hypothetical protein